MRERGTKGEGKEAKLTCTSPLSSRLMLTSLCVSMSLVTVAPFGPITFPRASVGTRNERILGMESLSGRGPGNASRMCFKMCRRPRLACASARCSVSGVSPSLLMSS